MGAPRFVSPGALASNAISQFLMQREADEQLRQETEFKRQQQEQASARQVEMLKLQQNQEARIAANQSRELDLQDAQQRMQRNQIGVRQMIGEALPSATPESARTIEGMAYSEGLPVPGVIAQMTAPPKAPTQFTLGEGDVRYDDGGNVIARGPDKRPAAGSPELEESRRLANELKALELERKRATLDQENAWREKTGEDAKRVTQTAYDLATRLKTHPGLAKSQGAFEMRGFTQDAQDYRGIRAQLVAALALPNLGALKGPMSDKDIIFVKNLATRLENDRLSDEEASRAIDEAITFLQSKGAAPAAGGTSSARALIDKYRGR